MSLPIVTDATQIALLKVFSKSPEEFTGESIKALSSDNPHLLEVVVRHILISFPKDETPEDKRKRHAAVEVFLISYRLLLESGGELPLVSKETCAGVVEDWNASLEGKYQLECFASMVGNNAYLAQFAASLTEGLLSEESDRSGAIGGVILCYKLLEAQAEADASVWS